MAAVVSIALGAWIWLRPIQRPNVILITIDTLRADHVGAYGDANAATPTLDGIARRGVRFVNVIAPAPLTLPSHASLFTGRTPPRHGVRNNPEFVLAESIPTLTERFREAGYETAAFVSGFPLDRRFGLARGFDVYDDRFPRGDSGSAAPYTERRADATVAAARSWLERRREERSARPYLLWVHLFDPHRPYDPPPPYRERFLERPYDGEIAFADSQIGALLEAAGDPAGTNTILAVTADHGEALDEHGEPTHGLFIYDSTIRIPLIVAGPGIRPGIVVEPTVRLIDVAPTLLERAGLPAIDGIDGRTLNAYLTGSAPPSPAPAYAESLFGRLCCGWAPLHGWRDGEWMYIDAPDPELYDVRADPGQRTNAAAAHPAEVARFKQALQGMVNATVDAGSKRDATAAKVLASVGYFSGNPAVQPSLRNPRDMAGLAARMEAAIAREHAEPAFASQELAAIVTEDPMNVLARRHLAIALAAKRDYPAAIREAEALRQMGDSAVETTVLLADCQRLAGRPADAVATLEAAIASDPTDASAHVALGRALTAVGRREDASAAFTRALALDGDAAEALDALADLALESGDLPTARRHLEALRSRDPDDNTVAVKLGTVLARSQELPQAIALFRSVVERSPSNIDALVNLAAALAKAGDAAGAVGVFERAVTAGATAPVVLNGLAMATLETGNRAGAVTWLKRSLSIRPDQPDIRQLLGRLESNADEREVGPQ